MEVLCIFIISQTSEPLPHLFKPPIIYLNGINFCKENYFKYFVRIKFREKDYL